MSSRLSFPPNEATLAINKKADRRWGFRASYGSKVREETGRLSPPQSVTAFRLSSMVIGRRSRLLSSNIVFLGLRRIIAL